MVVWSGSLKCVTQLLSGPFPVAAAWTANPRNPTMARRACLISANCRVAFFSGSLAKFSGSNGPPGYNLFSESSSAFLWNSMYPMIKTSIQIKVVMENGSGWPRYDDPSINSTWNPEKKKRFKYYFLTVPFEWDILEFFGFTCMIVLAQIWKLKLAKSIWPYCPWDVIILPRYHSTYEMTKLPLPLNQLNIYKIKNVKYYIMSFKQLF